MKKTENVQMFDFNSQPFGAEEQAKLREIEEQVNRSVGESRANAIKNDKIVTQFAYVKVPVSLLRLDLKNYQREANEHRVRKLTPFDPNKARGLAGIIQDDGIYLFDGGGRATAGVLEGYNEFWVAVYPNVTDRQAAELFASQDDGKIRVARMLKLRALLFAGDPDATDLHTIVKQYGYSLQFPYESGAKQKNIKAITKLLDVQEVYGYIGLMEMFEMYKKAGWEKYEETTHTIFLSMGTYLNQILAYCELHESDLGLSKSKARDKIIAEMKSKTPAQFLDAAHQKCGETTCNMHRDEAAIRMYMKLIAGVIS